MPFIPHTEDDVAAMLAAIGVDDIEQLFDEIPPELRLHELQEYPPGVVGDGGDTAAGDAGAAGWYAGLFPRCRGL